MARAIYQALWRSSRTMRGTHGGWLARASPPNLRAWFLCLQLVLETCVVYGWNNVWEIPLYVTVVVVSIIIVVLIGLALVTWMHHSDLVTSLLPPSAIQHLTDTMHADRSQKHLDESLPGSPAERLVTIMTMLAEGQTPPMADVVMILAALKNQTNLYLPDNLEQYVRKAANMDGEVAAALMAALAPGSGPGAHAGSAMQAAPGALHAVGAAQGAALLSGPCAVNKEALGEEQGYPDLTAVLQSITGIKEAPSLLSADAIDPTKSFEDFLVNTRGEAMSSAAHRTHRSLVFAEVEEEDVLGTVFYGHCLPPPAPMTQLEVILTSAASLNGDFDVWQLTDASNGHPLSALGYWCFHQSGILKELQLPSQKLVNFLRTIEAGYRPNPYHNKSHAADVLQTVYALLHTGGLRTHYADSLTTVGCFLAAIIHDFDHQGVTNDYLIATRNELAFRYNDRSPHENHHASAGLTLLNSSDSNFLDHLCPAEWSKMRKLVIDLVLSTDMKQHFSINGLFGSAHRLATPSMVKRIIDRAKAMVRANTVDASVLIVEEGGGSLSWDRPSATVQGSRDATPGPSTITSTPVNVIGVMSSNGRSANGAGTTRSHNGKMNRASEAPSHTPTQAQNAGVTASSGNVTSCASSPMPVDEGERLLALQMLLKCADLGHISTALHVHLKWVAALEEEMFQQGDQERGLGLPISPLCDRSQTGVTKSQIGFFDVVVLPLLANFTTRFPATRQILNTAVGNYHHWQVESQAAGNA